MISVIQSRYNISSYPSLVIDNNAYEGVVSKKQLGGLICEGLDRDVEECA